MADSDPTSVPAAIPFWKSPVAAGLIVSLLTAAAAKFNLQQYITGANVNDLANWILQGVSWVAGLVALHARVTSTVQPVTLTQSAADAKSTSPPQSGFASVSLLIALALVAVAACTFTGCSTVSAVEKSVGISQPLTFSEKYASGVAGCTAAIQTVDTLFNAKKITAADAGNTSEQIQNVKHAIDLANTLYQTDKATAGNKMDAALATLTALQTYLTQQGSK